MDKLGKQLTYEAAAAEQRPDRGGGEDVKAEEAVADDRAEPGFREPRRRRRTTEPREPRRDSESRGGGGGRQNRESRAGIPRAEEAAEDERCVADDRTYKAAAERQERSQAEQQTQTTDPSRGYKNRVHYNIIYSTCASALCSLHNYMYVRLHV